MRGREIEKQNEREKENEQNRMPMSKQKDNIKDNTHTAWCHCTKQCLFHKIGSSFAKL